MLSALQRNAITFVCSDDINLDKPHLLGKPPSTMTRKYQTVKVAAVQAAPVSFDLLASLKKVEELTAEAAKQGAQLVAFPEGFLSAYPWRYAFDATIGTREPRGMSLSG